MRLRERLVQVEVDDVEAHVAGPRPPHDRVEVRAVVVEVAPTPWTIRAISSMFGSKSPSVFGLVSMRQRDVLVGLRAQVVEVDAAVRVRADLDDLVARPSSPSPGSCRARCRA